MVKIGNRKGNLDNLKKEKEKKDSQKKNQEKNLKELTKRKKINAKNFSC